MVGLFFHRKSKRDHDATGPLPDFEPTAPALYDPRLADFEDTTPDALPGVPDLYAVIGVDPRASDDTIRYTYRRRAARLLDARWRPGRAARLLAELNAAYEILGKPDRRADYDRQRMRQAAYERARLAAPRPETFQTTSYSAVDSAPDLQTTRIEAGGTLRDAPGRVEIDGAAPARASRSARPVTLHGFQLRWPDELPRWPSGLLRWPNELRDAVLLALAAGLVLVVLAGLTSAAVSLYRSSMPPAREPSVGAARNATPAPTTAPFRATPPPVLVQRAVVPTATPVPPTPTLPPRPTAVARLSTGSGAIGTQVSISDQNPPRGSDVGVTVRLTRDRRPLADVPVALRVYYETVEERWPPGEEMVLTDASGEATIAFNIGDATPGYEAQVVALADVEGEPVEVQTSFVPR